jgi:hypothetical protein
MSDLGFEISVGYSLKFDVGFEISVGYSLKFDVGFRISVCTPPKSQIPNPTFFEGFTYRVLSFKLIFILKKMA